MSVPAHSTIAAIPCACLDRLQLNELAPAQLAEFANRASLLGLKDLLQAALQKLHADESLLEQFGAQRACMLSAAIARANNDPQTTFEMLDKARAQLSDGGEGFRGRLELDIRELSYRLDDPEDPALRTLLRRIRDQYLHKVPEIAEIIADQFAAFGCEHLLVELEPTAALAPASSGSLWTPGAESTANPAASLWLPGQS